MVAMIRLLEKLGCLSHWITMDWKPIMTALWLDQVQMSPWFHLGDLFYKPFYFPLTLPNI